MKGIADEPIQQFMLQKETKQKMTSLDQARDMQN